MIDNNPIPSAENVFSGLESVISETIRMRLAQRALPWRSAGGADLPAKPGSVACKAGLPGRKRARAVRSVCGVVRLIASEMVFLTGGREPSGRNRRFAMNHIEQIAMYVCHVVLQMTMTEIANACGKDRTTVGHACARVEDRRDDGAYDTLVGSIERVVDGVFGRAGRARPQGGH